MTREIKKVTVLGAGVMGRGIAAQLANAGIEVNLLDMVPKTGTDRNAYAKGALAAMKAAKPGTADAAFMDGANARFVKIGNYDDDLARAVGESDWVVEAIIENVKIKRDLFAKVDACMRPGTIVSSNTSSIPLKDLVEGRSENFAKNFLNTHFFNPPRFMKLLELISGPKTDPETTKLMRDFCDIKMGKNVVECNDSPAFIANRIGSYFIFRALAETLERKIPVSQADAILARSLGLGKVGFFQTLDMVGLSLIPHLTESLKRTLPADDAFLQIDDKPAMALINGMLADGRVGRMAKDGKGGFYRAVKDPNGGKTVIEVVDLETGKYSPSKKEKLPAVEAGKGRKGPRGVLEFGDDLSNFAWPVMRDTILYAASLVPAVSDNISDIDASMRDGYLWGMGPFEFLDKVGIDWFLERAQKDGVAIPKLLTLAKGQKFYRTSGGKLEHMTFDLAAGKTFYAARKLPDGVIDLNDFRYARKKPLLQNGSASLWDIGDGIACFEIISKMGTIDPSLLYALNESIKLISGSNGKYKGMVIASNAPDNFSLGANLKLLDEGFNFVKNREYAEGMINNIASLTSKKLSKMKLVPQWAADALNSSVKSIGKKLINSVHKSPETQKAGMEKLYAYTEDLIYQGQSVLQAMREAPFPVVGAGYGMVFGGGCEILMHCDTVQVSAETYPALVESGVGAVPAWGGCVRMLERVFNAQAEGSIKQGPLPPVRQAFGNILVPSSPTAAPGSAQDAIKKLWLQKDAGISMNAARVIADAKARALSLAPGYTPPKPMEFKLPGSNANVTLRSGVDDFYVAGQATYHDLRVADGLARILTGGNVDGSKKLTESDIKQAEREVFMSLLRTPETQARISFMLSANKPLREKPLAEPKSVDDIRAGREDKPLERREVTGKPMSGYELYKLRASAKITGYLVKLLGSAPQ